MIRKERKLNTEMIMVILALAWPTMLEQAMQTAVQYIDTAMVGSLGTYATAAVGATSTVSKSNVKSAKSRKNETDKTKSTFDLVFIGFPLLLCRRSRQFFIVYQTSREKSTLFSFFVLL